MEKVWSNEYMEGFQFGGFSSIDNGFYLTEHDAPTPKEKEIIEDIPFMQGVYDFSFLLGERVFSNRKITFELVRPLEPYEVRKQVQAEMKNALMIKGVGRLEDTYLKELNAYWSGKCESVTFSDSESHWTLKATVVFECYPFALKNSDGYSDKFDDEYFMDGIDQWTGFDVEILKNVLLINDGVNAVSPQIETDSNMTIEFNDELIEVKKGKNKDLFFKLQKGENRFTIYGNGHISFYIETEVMY